MIHYEFGDILLLLSFPFSDLGGRKKRPALVLADTGDADVLVSRITGEEPRDPYDYKIDQWKEYGLLIQSVVRVSKMASLNKGLVIKKMGRMGSPERRKIRIVLKKLFETA